MVKYYTTTSLFKYTWDQVATGLWQRYPNPNSKHVLTEDVLARYTENNKLICRRLLTKTNKIPKWGEVLVGRDSHVLIIEESIVDPVEKTLTTYTRNIGLQRIMAVEEKCIYKVNPQNSLWTVCERSAWITTRRLPFGFSSAVESFGLNRFKSNALKAALGFDYILTSLYGQDKLKDHPLSMSDKIKDTARKAADIAKSKAGPMMTRASTS
ncbi:protein preli-like [Plakobranchus ocellatus]|uniref:Protein preli-like n=1 Tax=Plakobranchus ocellatus TaxID=259542 RepID=A0AAV3YN72_9GAST|nr:protein preli-like [Plakobranchus ocellatus]